MHALRVSALVALCSLAGCGGAGPSAAASAQTQARSQEPEVLRVGQYSLRAQAMQSEALPEAAARAYNVPRSRRDVVLIITLRQGDDAVATSPADAAISVSAQDLLGRRREVALTPLHTSDLTDHIGTLRVNPPETLQFEVTARLPNRSEDDTSAPMQLRFARDFLP